MSSKAAKEAAKDGSAVVLPVELPAAKTTGDAPAVEVTVPKSAGSVKVEISVEKVTPGTVAVIVHADGIEEIVKTSIPTGDGIRLTVDGDVTVKIVDNAKDFTDTQSHWAEASIDFATSHELFSGTSATTFTPDRSMTRAMLMTVLARFDGKDTTGASAWYEKAMAWAKANGISDGSTPNGNITREQLAAMLWRYAGSPAGDGALSSFQDRARVSGYAVEAMRWAVGEGLISGTDAGMLAPQSNATRAQVATILKRFVESLSK
ncbi:MAG: S-layer homology domain-containing protein [Lawsonibacter sp.]